MLIEEDRISRSKNWMYDIHQIRVTGLVRAGYHEETCSRGFHRFLLQSMVLVGPAQDEGDLTMMDVPHNCVAFVTGRDGFVVYFFACDR